MYTRGFSEDETCIRCVFTAHVDVWGRNLSNESKGVSEAASHSKKNAKNDLWNDIEG